MAINDILPNSQADPSMPAWNTYQTKLQDALNRVVWENADAGQAIEDAVMEAQAEVDNKLGK
jgi:maltose-binding protein MalE